MTDRIAPTDLQRIRERHDDIEQDAIKAVDHAPILCRFLGDTETCRMGLDIAEHDLETAGWRHPDGLDAKGYWAFGEKAINR